MKANEFVKKFGWGAAYDLWTGAFPLYENNMCILNGCVCTLSSDFMFNLLELKRLVESHELVEACGGIDVVKRHLKEGNVFRFEEKPLMRQAIADVESCQ